MNTHDIKRYAVSGDIAYPVCEDPEGDYVTYEDHVAAIEADRKRRGEPDFFTYVINGHHRGISETAPPDDSYDEGSLQPLYTAPQPAEPSFKLLPR